VTPRTVCSSPRLNACCRSRRRRSWTRAWPRLLRNCRTSFARVDRYSSSYPSRSSSGSGRLTSSAAAFLEFDCSIRTGLQSWTSRPGLLKAARRTISPTSEANTARAQAFTTCGSNCSPATGRSNRRPDRLNYGDKIRRAIVGLAPEVDASRRIQRISYKECSPFLRKGLHKVFADRGITCVRRV
jgi:hypothetical protein